MLTPALIVSLNHLLRQNSWALPALTANKGKHLRLALPGLDVSLAVSDSGYFQAAGSSPPNAIVKLSGAGLLRLATNNFRDSSALAVEGEVEFATTVLKTMRALHWDAAEDLSKIMGDIAAERAVSTVTAAWEWQKSLVQNMAQTSSEFFKDEEFLLARPEDVQDWVRAVAELRDRAARFEKRLTRLR